jgi:hypothetical protein
MATQRLLWVLTWSGLLHMSTVLAQTSSSACSLCSDGTSLMNKNLIIPGTNASETCATSATAASELTADSAECTKLQERAPACCDGIASCSLCADGATPGNTTRPVDFPGLPVGIQSCADFWYGSYFFTSPNCLANLLIGQSGFPFDFPSFCECPNAKTNANACGDLCRGKKLINADTTIEVPNAPAAFTCSNLYQLYPYLTNPEQCSVFDSLAPVCCQGVANCTLCEDDAAISYPQRRVPYDNVTCEETKLLIYLAADCTDFDTLQSTEVDIRSYCGCRGSTDGSSNSTCATCPDGTRMNKPDKEVPEAAATCQDLYQYASYLKPSTDTCSRAQQDLADYCCGIPGSEGSTSQSNAASSNGTRWTSSRILIMIMTLMWVRVGFK